MAITRGPSIVRDGLVLCLDAKDPNSYSGSGSTWSDLTTNGNNATIVNATYNSNGYFTFDGTGDYMTCSTATGWTSLTDMCAFVIARPTTISRRHYLFDSRYTASGSSPSFGLGLDSNSSPFNFAQDSSGYDEATSPTTFSTNNFFIFGLFRQGNSIQILDSDSVTKITPSIASNTLGTGALTPAGYAIGAPHTLSDTYTWIGDIAAVWIYNRVLSQAECTQNYNAMKSRFSI
jgi:hypothetical protein